MLQFLYISEGVWTTVSNAPPDNELHNNKNNWIREITILTQKTTDIAVVYVYTTSQSYTPVTCCIHADHSITTTRGVDRLKLTIRTETYKMATVWLTIESWKFKNI